MTIPPSFTNGTATITDTCGNSLTLTIGCGRRGTALPRTGSDTGTLGRVAVALVAAGGVLVLGRPQALGPGDRRGLIDTFRSVTEEPGLRPGLLRVRAAVDRPVRAGGGRPGPGSPTR